MDYLSGRLQPILAELKDQIVTERYYLDTLRMQPCGYHQWEMALAPAEAWPEYHRGDVWGGVDEHVCFQARVALPASFEGRHVVCTVVTGKTDIWNYDNPQFLAYLDGELVCGLDVNHNEFDIARSAEGSREVWLSFYGYCNTRQRDLFMTVSLGVKDDELEQVYYDLKVPFDVYQTLLPEEENALKIASFLHQAVNCLDLREIGSEAFRDSLRQTVNISEPSFARKHAALLQ